MLMNLGQLRAFIAQEAGIKNTNGVYDFDDSTQPTLDQVNIYINNAIRESCASWDYTFLETSKSYPFNHTISGVQGATFYATTSGIFNSGPIVPWPSSVLNFSQFQNIDASNTLVGISFVGTDSVGNTYNSISSSGLITYDNTYVGIGYTYQLDNDVDKLHAIMISQSISGVSPRVGPLGYVEWHDLERMIPIGIISASGCPIWYTEFPGLSNTPLNEKTIQFFPTPLPNFNGESFIVHYKKKHVDMINDTDYQNVIPEQYQTVITQASLEKIFDILDNPKIALVSKRKEDIINDMRIWDGTQPNKIFKWRDYNYRNSASRLFDNTDLVWTNDV